MKNFIHKKPDEILAENSSASVLAVKENTAKVEENTRAIKDLHITAKDRSETILGFTGALKRLDKTNDHLENLKDVASDKNIVRKLEEVKSASLISNKLLKEIKEKKMPEPKEFPKEMEVSLKGVSVVTIKGDRGEKGDKGDRGEKGESIRGEKGEQGIQGKTGSKGEKGDKGERGSDGSNGKNGKNGNDGSPDQPDEIIEKINNAEKKIDPKQVKGLPALMRDIDAIGKFPRGAAASGIGDLSLKFFVDDISSQLDGSTKSFTIAQNRIILDVKCSSFPHVFRETIDYTISGISRETITFTNQIDATATFASGQTLIITGIRP